MWTLSVSEDATFRSLIALAGAFAVRLTLGLGFMQSKKNNSHDHQGRFRNSWCKLQKYALCKRIAVLGFEDAWYGGHLTYT